jgi:GntR family transcriptional regulator/MocR family aminotransferase
MSIAVTPSGSLADDLGVARDTVVEAYTQLAAEGWLISVAGSGTYVGRTSTATRPAPARRASAGCQRKSGTM